MRLDAWLKQPHPIAERLRLVERLAQALNAVHDRGETLAAIAPERVEVGNDLRCDLSPASRGPLEPGYAAPERLDGGPPSTAADVYAVGALCYEILSGRPCGESPRPLPEVARDLPSELANSVMGCLEKSPDWRPKDLTYLAQLAAAQQKGASAPEPLGERAKAKPRAAARTAAPVRTAPRRASRSHLPLAVAAVLLVAAAASSYLWLNREPTRAAPAARAATPAPVATPTPEPTATPAPAASAPAAAPAVPKPSAAPTPEARVEVPMAAVAEPEPTPTPTPTPAPAAAAEPVPPEPQEPASLTALSPLSVRRPGKVLLDIRGSGLRADQRVRVLQLKEPPRGITVLRQKWTNAGLVSVLLELDATVTPAAYSIVLENAAGALSNPLQLQVTK